MTLKEFNLIQDGWMEGYKLNVENLRIQTWLLYPNPTKGLTAKQIWPLPWDNEGKKEDVGEYIRNNIQKFDEIFPKTLN